MTPEDTAGSATAAEIVPGATTALSLPRCPICRARLRENTGCPRCGADLAPLLQIARDASNLERVAVAHLLDGEWALAKAALIEVQSLRSSELCGQLLAFAEHQLLAPIGLPDKHSGSNERVAEHSSLENLDLSVIERYG